MKLSLKQDIREWGNAAKNALWFLGKHAFVATLVFVLGAALVAVFLFWQYVIFFPRIGQEPVVSEFAFEKELFNNLLSELEQQEAKVREANFLTPQDPFHP